VSLEPVPRVCAALAGNVAQNGLESRVTILNVAAGDSNGVVDFHEAENALMGSLRVNGYKGQPGKIIQVQCRTLDSIVDECNIEPDFIKIDVEGFEDAVLVGARQLLYKFRPHIVLEANPGDPCAGVTKILKEHGYTMHLITDEGIEVRDEIIAVERYRNWFCRALP
jgi:FkbM family methyltransferase